MLGVNPKRRIILVSFGKRLYFSVDIGINRVRYLQA